MSEPRVRVWRGVPSHSVLEAALSELDARDAYEFATTWRLRREDGAEDARQVVEADEPGYVETGTISGDEFMRGRPNFAEGLVTVLAGAVDVDHLERVQ